MSDGSPIEWLDRPGTKPASWNPLRAARKVLGQETQGAGSDTRTGWYCEHVHEGCRNCYAESFNLRLGNGLEYKPGNRDQLSIFLDKKTLLQPLKWKSPRTIFVCSMTDLYGPWVKDEWLDKIKAVQALTPQHTYIELTKRPERMRDYLSNPARERIVAGNTWSMLGTPKGSKVKHGGNWRKTFPLANCWGLVSCSTQEDADKFIPILLNTPMAIRGVSAEPLLGPIDFTRICLLPQKPGSIRAGIHINALVGRYCESGVTYTGDWDITGPAPDATWPPLHLDWIIIGGESGRNARPMHPDWARSIKAQCEAAGVPMFFKQFGEWAPSSQQEWESDDESHAHSLIAPDGRFGDTVADLLTKPPGTAWVRRLGKTRAGRLLDGAEHNGFPQARTT